MKEKDRKNNSEKDNSHNRDISSKDIFKNPVLCAQFLRDNVDIPILKNVQPEDIEDVSERYHPYLGTEFESDSVSKIRILDIERKNIAGVGNTNGITGSVNIENVENITGGINTKNVQSQEITPPFLISLIDHKSLVDYDVSMQLLRYMVCIWTEYRRDMEKKHKGISSRKGFRYPIILPIVYYEGRASWSAARNLCERIGMGSALQESEYREWIPDFRYELVNINKYSDQELLERGDEISLIMLINKMQNTADLEKFLRIPADKLDPILKNSPEHVVDVMVSVMESLCFKMDIPAEERLECVRKVRERKMGYLWENMEKFSIREERQKTEEQRKKAEEEHQRAEAEHQRAEEQQKRADVEHQKAEEQKKNVEEERQKVKEQRQRAERQQKRAEEQQRRAEKAEAELQAAREMIERLQKNSSYTDG